MQPFAEKVSGARTWAEILNLFANFMAEGKGELWCVHG